MADFPTLAEVIAEHADSWFGEIRYRGITAAGFRSCSCGRWKDDNPAAQYSRASFGAHVQAEWVKACTIETVDQLDALPDLAAVRAGEFGAIWHKNGRYNSHEPWWGAGSDVECPTTDVALPAILLWHPERDR
ncbi:hypothetical protein [Mycolicibacterium fortuitum]|uniref:hypothetical protein n=1 Tax=Mycolicibacterium fortuitum TaxID=1766 RepID=UPI00260E6905|nr:hypothetical protein [Mycolicibacterium fortuitum]